MAEIFEVEQNRTVLGRLFGACSRRGPETGAGSKRRPRKSTVMQLNDPMCDPNTLVYCLFRYRRNRGLVFALLDKLEKSEHPSTDSYTLHLCYLTLIEPLAAPLEQWLIARAKTSLHFAEEPRIV